MTDHTEYTVHFQKGTRVGTRSLQMERVIAVDPSAAIAAAKLLFHDHRQKGYRVTRVDHFDEETGHVEIDR
jgi:hypothetical protein